MRAILALENGTVFHGRSVGAPGQAVGEVVFNTAMTGYQEILTDPSYARQLVTLTYPHIGNTGWNASDAEHATPIAEGLIVRDMSVAYSSWRAEGSLEAYLTEHGRPAIADIDTRKLTRILRDEGAQAGCILASEAPGAGEALAAARAFPGLRNMDLARVVSTTEPYAWTQGSFDLDRSAFGNPELRWHVVAYDFGIKRNILRLLADHGCRVTVVPATTPADDVLAREPDGVFLSNGPGDPEPCTYAIAAIRAFIEAEIPVFGICLGLQLLGLAAGGRTRKMKFGHHGANHPVHELATDRVLITSQNHGFTVDEDSLPPGTTTTHRSLFDGSLQGIELAGGRAFGFQGHPEASPGPHDVRHLFARFAERIAEARASA